MQLDFESGFLLFESGYVAIMNIIMNEKSKVISLIFITCCIFCFVQKNDLFAQSQPEEIPPGMELRTVGKTRIVVPIGAKIEERDGLIIVEGIDKYVARSIDTMDNRLDESEKNIQAQKESLQRVMEKLSALEQFQQTEKENPVQ